MNIQELADQLLLQHFSPASVLVNENGDIIYINGRTGKYLEPAVGKANLNIFAMLREGLRNEFPVAFRRAVLRKEKVILHHLKVGTNGGTQLLNVTIHCIEKPEPLKGTVMIVFNDLPETIEARLPKSKTLKISVSARESELEDEVQRLREEMQNSIEEMQTSQEELKSTNEELQSTNEELQSTNEELTTSKEEMQSLNEELQTVNGELQLKVDDYSRVNNDMKNLLNSTDIATLFLDKELNIRRFTNQATKIFKLIKSDIGRPITDQVSELIYPGLVEDSLEVLRTLVFIQKQIPTRDGRWFSIRIMPYRTFDDRIDGLVLTFFNLSEFKQLEEKLQESEHMQQLLLNLTSHAVVKISAGFEVLEFNYEAEKYFGKKREEALGKNFVQLFIAESMQKKTERDLKKLMNDSADATINLNIPAEGSHAAVIKWSVFALHNTLKTSTGMILSTKKTTS